MKITKYSGHMKITYLKMIALIFVVSFFCCLLIQELKKVATMCLKFL